MRIVPTFGVVIIFCTFVLPLLGSGPQWNLVVNTHADNCKTNWWLNLLFIHNYFGFSKMVCVICKLWNFSVFIETMKFFSVFDTHTSLGHRHRTLFCCANFHFDFMEMAKKWNHVLIDIGRDKHSDAIPCDDCRRFIELCLFRRIVSRKWMLLSDVNQVNFYCFIVASNSCSAQPIKCTAFQLIEQRFTLWAFSLDIRCAFIEMWSCRRWEIMRRN